MSARALLPLKPCPFCGGTNINERQYGQFDLHSEVWCANCQVSASNESTWNRRAEPSAWQPIELAPHDTKVLLWWPEQEEAYKGFWMNSATGNGGWWVCDGPTPMGKPTHFQFLPAAPKVS